jgi:hypothetical protein
VTPEQKGGLARLQGYIRNAGTAASEEAAQVLVDAIMAGDAKGDAPVRTGWIAHPAMELWFAVDVSVRTVRPQDAPAEVHASAAAQP